MKSHAFFKPTLATTLAIVLAWLTSVRPAQAGGYTVTLRQVGPDVVATGGGTLDLTGLTRDRLSALPDPTDSMISSPYIVTGATDGPRDLYEVSPLGLGGGGGFRTFANSASGDLVGVFVTTDDVGAHRRRDLVVPRGYVSGRALSDSATYSGKTFAT